MGARIGSREQLDLFLLLGRDRSRWWSVTEVAEELAVAPETAGMRLFLLTSAGLLRSDNAPAPRYAFLSNPALAHIADTMLIACEADRDALYSVVSGGQSNQPAKQFADAFKLRKS